MATSAIIKYAADALQSLNPRLPALPPPSTEQTGGRDVCFIEPTLLCKDLPDEIGMRGVISSWYLSPTRHVVEIAIFSVLSGISLAVIIPRLSRYPNDCSKKLDASNLRPPLLLRILIGICFSLQIVYKVLGYPGKLYMMLMPCNVLWCLHFAHAFVPMSANSRHVLAQLCITYVGLPIVAIATPDLSDLTLPYEVEYFFLNHALLLVFPLYWVSSAKVSLLPMAKSGESVLGCFAKWYLLACTVFALFYFALVTPVAIYSGLNLNYMLSPPPNPGNVVSGENFRLMSTGCCATLFFIMRFGAVVGEIMAAAVLSKVRVSMAKNKKV